MAVITGSGMERLFQPLYTRDVTTSYGGAKLLLCSTGVSRFYCVPRHGEDHEVPPHRINFKANLAALKEVGVGVVIATGAVGSMTRKFGVGELGLLDQFIDMSKRHLTFFEETASHTDMTEPYDRLLRRNVLTAARALGVRVADGLVYVSVDGPRYETPAEIRMFRRMGGHVVGMTGAHEVILAREAGIRYASLVISTNWAAGMQEKVTHDDVVRTMRRKAPAMRRLLERAVDETEARRETPAEPEPGRAM